MITTEQVYYNPSQRKLLFSVTGTHNLRDYGTDLWLAAGKYQEAKNILHRAKQKYHISNATLAGHSLGGLVPVSYTHLTLPTIYSV